MLHATLCADQLSVGRPFCAPDWLVVWSNFLPDPLNIAGAMSGCCPESILVDCYHNLIRLREDILVRILCAYRSLFSASD